MADLHNRQVALVSAQPLPPRSPMLDHYENLDRWNTGGGQFEKTGSHFLPKLSNNKIGPLDVGSTNFKKTHSVVQSKFLSPTGAAPLNLIHGLADDMFKNKTGLVEEANFDSHANPFKFKRNTQEMLIQREKERYMKWARKEASHLDAYTAGSIDQNAVSHKIATLKGKLDQRNHSMKSHSQLEKVHNSDPEMTGIMALAHSKQEMTQKKTSKREGILRMVSTIGDNQIERLEAQHRQLSVLRNAEYYRTGNHTSLVRRSKSRDDSANSRGSLESPIRDANQPKMLTSNNNIISIRDFPPTSRYLFKNIFGSANQTSPKESTKEVINNMRTMFYTKMAIDAKHEETVKLKEYIVMDQEKIIEARVKFEEDCDKFTKYVRDVDQQTEVARKTTEEAIKKRLSLNEEIDFYQEEIAKNERDWLRTDDFVKQYTAAKNFFDSVKVLKVVVEESSTDVTASGTKSQSSLIKNQQGKQVKGSQQLSKASSKESLGLQYNASNKSGKKKDDEPQSTFFITEKIKKEEFTLKSKDEGVGLSQSEFLYLIQDLEDQNIFILDNIEKSEAELESIQQKSKTKYRNEEKMILQLKKNNDYFKKMITEKKQKRVALEAQMNQIRGQNRQSRSSGSLSNSQSGTLSKNGSQEKFQEALTVEQKIKIALEEKKLKQEAEQMKKLKQQITQLFLRLKGSKLENENLDIIQDIIYQLGFIQKSLDLLDEQRDYIVAKHRVLKGAGDQEELKSIENYKNLLEAEKQVDRDRKDQRLEKKLQEGKEQEARDLLRLKKRQERMEKLHKTDNPTKPNNMRSEKPSIQRVDRNIGKTLTQEEMDFHKYVMGSQELTDSVIQAIQQKPPKPQN